MPRDSTARSVRLGHGWRYGRGRAASLFGVGANEPDRTKVCERVREEPAAWRGTVWNSGGGEASRLAAVGRRTGRLGVGGVRRVSSSSSVVGEVWLEQRRAVRGGGRVLPTTAVE